MRINEATKEKIKRVLYIAIMVLLLLWGALTGLQTQLNCIILQENKSSVENDTNAVEVSEVYANGDFRLEGSSDLHSSTEIEEYARVPKEMGYYYRVDKKIFVAPITNLESQEMIAKYAILDTLCYIILVVAMVKICSTSKTWKRVVAWVLFEVEILLAQCILTYSCWVLFGIGDEIQWVLIGKNLVLVAVLIVKKILSKKKAFSKRNVKTK